MSCSPPWERHAEQLATIATAEGIPSAHVHYSMTDKKIRDTRARFEDDAGDLQGLVQLKMFGQGYDFPAICVVVPMRPYGSFSEFYQFIGRGIRVINHPALIGRVGPGEQWLDIVYHAELGLDDHIETIYTENDMDPQDHTVPLDVDESDFVGLEGGVGGSDTAQRLEAFVLFERGDIEQRVVHDEERMEQRRAQREEEALAQRYAVYAQSTETPASFEQFVTIMRQHSEWQTAMTFGQRYTDADSVGARLELERQERRRETFAQIDAVLRELVRAALSGEKVGAAEVDATRTRTLCGCDHHPRGRRRAASWR